MARINVNGVEMSYEVRAPGDAMVTADADAPAGREGRSPTAQPDGRAAPPLVLLHGFPLDARVWADVARLTGREVLTIRPNLRGFERLTSLEPFTIEQLAADTRALLEALGALPCVLAGLSMGGYVALAFAEQHAEHLWGLALVDTRAAADDEAGRRRRDDMIALLRKGGVSAVVDQMHPNLLAPATYERAPAVADALMRIMLDTPAPTIEHACMAMRDRADRRGVLARLKVPTAILVGEHDRITPVAEAQAMAEAAPGASFNVIPGAGHLSPLEQPRAVAEALLSLVRRAGSRDAQAAASSLDSGFR